MGYIGKHGRKQLGGWFADNWTLDSRNRVTLGTRIDYENSADAVFLSPRASWFHQIDSKRELTLGAGLYSQDNYEFYYRDNNPKLASEKALHMNAEYSWDVTPDYKLEFSGWGKFYYDLATIRMRSLGEITDMYQFEEGLSHELGIEEWELSEYIRNLDSTQNTYDMNLDEYRALLGDEIVDRTIDIYGKQEMVFDNNGIGLACGAEARLHYDPTPFWRGWVSYDASLSKRQDERDGVWYNFRKHRMWAVKWHNYFDMPGQWELSFKLEYSSGLVYTGYTDLMEYDWEAEHGDTLLVIERKNNRRYAPYTKFDIRLEKNSTLFGHPTLFFFEVWNATNEPNFILTDSETGRIKYFDLSYPFPIVFLGYEFRW